MVTHRREVKKMKVIFYYKMHEDNFEGIVNDFFFHKEIQYQELNSTMIKMAEDSDGERSYTPFCVCLPDGCILKRFD